MQQQKPLIQVQQQVFPAPANADHHPADQTIRLTSQRPTQGFSYKNTQYTGTRDSGSETSARDFNLW